MAEQRWSAVFVGMLESLGMGEQFRAGRRYARAGHVHQLTISSSLVTGLVLDEDGQTFRARIAVRAFSAADWARVERELSRQAYYAAKLLAGQLPHDIDVLFARFGLTLFPDSIGDVALDCSCPGWQVPCRHLTALAYALAASFDADPFGILAWRGRGRDELLDRLRALRVQPRAVQPLPASADAGADLPASEAFWIAGGRAPAPEPAVPGSVRRPDVVLDQLDHLALHAGRHDVVELLRPAYRRLTDRG